MLNTSQTYKEVTGRGRKIAHHLTNCLSVRTDNNTYAPVEFDHSLRLQFPICRVEFRHFATNMVQRRAVIVRA